MHHSFVFQESRIAAESNLVCNEISAGTSPWPRTQWAKVEIYAGVKYLQARAVFVPDRGFYLPSAKQALSHQYEDFLLAKAANKRSALELSRQRQTTIPSKATDCMFCKLTGFCLRSPSATCCVACCASCQELLTTAAMSQCCVPRKLNKLKVAQVCVEHVECRSGTCQEGEFCY